MTTPDDQAAGRGGPTGPSAAQSSAAQQLLTEISDRIGRLQNDLAARDMRINQLEAELRKTAGDLLDERTARAREFQETTRQITAQLGARERELDAQRSAALAEAARLQARERELQAQLATAKRQYDEARTALSAARAEADGLRSATSQSSSAQTARGPQAEGKTRDRRQDDLKDLIGRLDGEYAASRWRGQRGWVARAAPTLAAVAISAAIGILVWSYQQPAYRATGLLIAAPEQLETVERLTRTAGGGAVAQVTADACSSTVHVSITAPQPDTAAERLAGLGASVQAAWLDGLTPGTQPAATQTAELASCLADVERRLAITETQPTSLEWLASDVKKVPALLSLRQTAVKTAQAAATRAAAPLPDEDSITIDADQVSQAEKADARLQADTSTLAGREEQLAGMLRTSLDAGLPRFAKVAETTAAAVKVMAEPKAAEAADTADVLTKLVQSVEASSKSAETLGEAWKKASAELSRAGADTLAIQSSLEPLAHRFIDESAATAETTGKLMESLAQGGEEPTKRLVLRSALVRELQPATDAREALMSAARTVVAADNLELSAIRQRVAGLRSQVQQQRERVREGVKRTLVAQARSRHASDLTEADKQRAALVQRAAEIDTELLKTADDLGEQFSRLHQQLSDISFRAALYRQRGDLIREKAELDAEAQVRMTSTAPPRFIATPPELLDSPEARAAQAVLAALAALGLFLLGFAAVRTFTSWLRRSERALSNSLRTLEKIS